MFCVVFYVVRAMHKFDFMIVIKKTASKNRPGERSYSESDPVFDGKYMFPPGHFLNVKGKYMKTEKSSFRNDVLEET